MSHRDRSIANMRCEAKRIYNQRRYINKLERQISKAVEYIENNKLNDNKISEMLCGSEIITLLEILGGEKDK